LNLQYVLVPLDEASVIGIR
ncbi:hypothetical protein AZ019_004506, partial [Klebsiella pneumoniae]